MAVFYFGDSDKPLFGYHHEPQSHQYRSASVVICNPIGHEYIRSYSLLRNLANQLAMKGYHVLRFDYFATGDSSGDSERGSIAQWLNDIQSACEEIRDISGDSKVHLLGLRFGGLLAAMTCEKIKVDRLLLWEPVLSGENYLVDLRQMHGRMLDDSNRFYRTSESITETQNEFLGYPYLPGLQQDFLRCKLLKEDIAQAKRLDIFSNSLEPIEEYFQDVGEHSNCQLHQASESGRWQDIHVIEDMFIANQTVAQIIQTMGD